jgi:hypothetical protein
MRKSMPSRVSRPIVEPLEGRALMATGPSAAAIARAAIRREAAEIARADLSLSGAGESTILSALNGGAGHEFVTLIKKEVKNLDSVILQFATGAIKQYSVPGFVAEVPTQQPLYTGNGYDRIYLTEAGAVLLKGNVLELGAITRGPFSQSDATSQIVFAINRGAGGSLGPAFPSNPGITPDALVTLTIGPYASSVSGTITDLVTNQTQTIASNEIQVDGPVARVLVNSSQIPSEGFSLKHYTFAAWTVLEPSAGISSVGSFAPFSSMIPIGLLTTVKPPKL